MPLNAIKGFYGEAITHGGWVWKRTFRGIYYHADHLEIPGFTKILNMVTMSQKVISNAHPQRELTSQ